MIATGKTLAGAVLPEIMQHQSFLRLLAACLKGSLTSESYCKGGPHHVSKKSADFRCQKRTLWTWQDAAPVVTERSTNVETLPLYIAEF